MRSTTYACVGTALAACLAQANPIQSKRQTHYTQAMYWGQENNERSLADYCASSEGVDIVVLAFLSNFGDGVTPNGSFDSECTVDSNGNGDSCGSLENDINTCKSLGKKVFMSIGGADGNYGLNSQNDATGVAYTLWNSYANPDVVASGTQRPIGNAFVDGWDLDIEKNDGSAQYYPDLVNALRAYFPSDSSNTYYISGAPQCPLPEENMGDAILNSQFDYLFIQFYNNPYCSAYQVPRPDGGQGDGFNFDDWYSYVQGSPSANAQLLIGLPASKEAADSSTFYITTSELPNLLNTYKSHAGFGGVMLWDAGNSDIVNVNGCHYDQEVRSVLDTGNACS